MNLVAKLAIGAAALGLPLAAYAGTSHENEAAEKAEMAHAPKPAISKSQAERIAMATARGGKIVDSEYEKEGGGWRWSFDISQNGKLREQLGEREQRG
ncbi:PepSY domain-containing protein [Tsuneonella sp. YG55]|uniref:PepSY domain-containing protein n=1 Tax=Tsuneonella litorea TaxID=2976475 RepID=A0A9X2W420_9SPHN|nr:PepSY domain-containing protein [Tsuneonella litorea]MCT2560204.1 PepSY domain-containing protein [Tsuneonella litorea]